MHGWVIQYSTVPSYRYEVAQRTAVACSLQLSLVSESDLTVGESPISTPVL